VSEDPTKKGAGSTEAEETIKAINQGNVDALVINGPAGPQVVMLQTDDQPYRMLVERMSEGAVTLGPDNRILYANRRLADLSGELPEALIGRQFDSLFEETPIVADNADVPARLRSAGKTLPVSIWSSSIFVGGLSVKLVTISDRSVEQRVEEAVGAERFARSILEQSTEAILVLGPNGRIARASLVAEEIARHPPVGRMFSEAFEVERETTALSLDRLNALLATRPFHGMEMKLRHPRLGPCSFLLSAGPLVDDARTPIGAIVTLTDITARKRAEEQQTMLVAELNHRVKNILAVVQAISSQTVRTSSSLPVYSATFAGRIKALSVAHDILTRTRWKGIGLNELLESVLSPYLVTGGERISLSGPPVLLPARTVVPLSMAVHELATNASKYGALSSQRGRVSVDWSLAQNGHPLVDLSWQEEDGPGVAEGSKSGFGTTLIRRVISQDLEGTVELDFAPGGLRSVLQFPLRTQLELNDLLGGAQH
jgi:PAS domain S-box-containing protein